MIKTVIFLILSPMYSELWLGNFHLWSLQVQEKSPKSAEQLTLNLRIEPRAPSGDGYLFWPYNSTEYYIFYIKYSDILNMM